MDNLMSIGVSALVVMGVIVLAGSVMAIILRMRSGEPFAIPSRLLLRAYLYLMSLVSIIVLAFGLAGLARAGLGAALGEDFSYYPSYVSISRPPAPVEAPGVKPAEPWQPTPEQQEEQRKQGLRRAWQEGLLNGISLVLVGGAMWLLHAWGRRKLETPQERQELLNRLYVVLLVLAFGVMTLSSLSSGIYDGLSYYLLEPRDETRNIIPGRGLSYALVALPLWAYYLRTALRIMRHPDRD